MPHPLPFHFQSQKSRLPRAITQTQHKQVIIILGTNPHWYVGLISRLKQHSRRENLPRTQQSQQQPPLPALGVPQEQQGNNQNKNVEDLAQSHASSMIAYSISMSPYEACFFDSLGHVCSQGVLNSSDAYNSPHFHGVPWAPRGRT